MSRSQGDRAGRGPVAAVDCGTNTVRLLVGSMPEVELREMRVVRLGQGVDRDGRLSDEALQRAFAAVEEYAGLIAERGADRVRCCATSATRDAENAADLVGGVTVRLGVRPEVLTGAQEAELTYTGAVRHLARTPPGPLLVVDIGGGSTELVLGEQTPTGSDSLDIGSVRLHERYVRHDPPTTAEIAAATAQVDAALAACPVETASAGTVIGVAGTVVTVAAGVLGLPELTEDAVDGQVLAADDVHAEVDRLLATTVAQRRALPWMHPGRVDVVGMGGLILSCVLRHARAESLVVSVADILDGIAWSLVEGSASG